MTLCKNHSLFILIYYVALYDGDRGWKPTNVFPGVIYIPERVMILLLLMKMINDDGNYDGKIITVPPCPELHNGTIYIFTFKGRREAVEYMKWVTQKNKGV